MQLQARVVERHGCPVCGSRAFTGLIRESFASPAIKGFIDAHYEGRADPSSIAMFDFEVVRCGDCSLAYQRTIPGPELLNEIYEKWIPQSERDRLHQQYTPADYSYWAEQVQYLIAHFGENPYALRVFDFGMGWSEWAAMAKGFGCQVSGAELSQIRIDHARSIGIEVLSWDEIPGRNFHFINTEQVFEHLLEPLETLKHLVRGLDARGIIKISVPDSRQALKKLSHSHDFGALSADEVMPLTPLEHVNCFEYRSLAALAKRAGLRPMVPSLHLLYNSSSGWLHPKRAARLLLRPLYRHWYPKSTFVYFVREK